MATTNTQDDGTMPTDVGRTSGGGSVGHKAPSEVNEEGPIRNQPARARSPRNAKEDPVMPSNDSTLDTKI
jgi:hypothetical protein